MMVWFKPAFDLPKDDGWVLAVKKYEDGMRQIVFARYIHDGLDEETGGWFPTSGEVTHWMPLPKLPEEGRR